MVLTTSADAEGRSLLEGVWWKTRQLLMQIQCSQLGCVSVVPTRASKRAKAMVEMADICAIFKDWNSPDPYMEGEDTWVGCDTCGRWFHSHCCADTR